MLDVIHYMFEEDFTYETDESEHRKTQMRKHLYRDYYNKKYLYGARRKPASSNSSSEIDDDLDLSNLEEAEDLDIQPFNPKNAPAKPYTPPTPFNENAEKPFGLDLDAPLK